MGISLCSHSSCHEMIATKFYTCHDGCAVMACEKFYSDIVPQHGVTLKPIFHRIWISRENSLVKWCSGPRTHCNLGAIQIFIKTFTPILICIRMLIPLYTDASVWDAVISKWGLFQYKVLPVWECHYEDKSCNGKDGPFIETMLCMLAIQIMPQSSTKPSM